MIKVAMMVTVELALDEYDEVSYFRFFIFESVCALR